MNIEFYRCMETGKVAVLWGEGGDLSCGGKPMKKLTANTTDGAREKHVPAVTKEDGKLKVQVGSVEHPMLAEHYIEWIALVTEDAVQIRYLKPGDKPAAVFEEVASGTVYEYCNLHGLWKAEF